MGSAQEEIYVADSVLTNDLGRPVLSMNTLTASGGGGTAAGASVTVEADGTFRYTPPTGGLVGRDSFQYTMRDDLSGKTARATVVIDGQPDPSKPFTPVPHNYHRTGHGSAGTAVTYTTVHDRPLGAAGDAPSLAPMFTLFGGADVTYSAGGGTNMGGTVTMIDQQAGTFRYNPPAGFVGWDYFSANVSTSTGASTKPQRVYVHVTNFVPQAVYDEYYVTQGATVTGTVWAIDDDDDALTYRPAVMPAHGQLDLNDDGTFTYRPDANFVGVDALSYFAVDGPGIGGLGTFYFNVQAGPQVNRITRAEIEFTDDRLKFDDGTSPSRTQWLDVDGDGDAEDKEEKKDPLRFNRSTPGKDRKVALRVKFTFAADLQGRYTVTGTSAGLRSPLSFKADADGQGKQLSVNLTSTEKLLDVIDLGNLAIQWTITKTGEQIRYGTSVNRTYVTGGTDFSANTFVTVLDIGCRNAQGLRPAEAGELDPGAGAANQQVVDSIWGDFTDLSVLHGDGVTVMRYNHDDDAKTDVDGLVKDKKGTCGAWADLLAKVLQAQGIGALNVTVTAVPKQFRDAETTKSRFKVKAGPAQGSGGNNYEPTEFENHAVVKVIGFPHPNIVTHPYTIYDPSYGRVAGGAGTPDMQTAEMAWENAAIVAYQYEFRDATGEDNVAPWTPNDENKDELDFDV